MRGLGQRRIRIGRGSALVGLITLAAAAVASASHPALTYSSTFDSNTDGWIAYVGPNLTTLTWQASGGTLNGYVSADFPDGVGDIDSAPDAVGSTWPAGNALGDYGGTLSVDVRVHLAAAASDEDLWIGFVSDNAAVAVCDDVGQPTSSWTRYTLKLDTSELKQCFTGSPLTRAQASAELAGFGQVFVLAKNSDDVAETLDVDNAELSGPNVAMTAPTGKVGRTVTLAYRAHRLTGSLTSPDDYSCVGKAKVTIFRKAKHSRKIGTVTASAPNVRLSPAPAKFGFTLKRGVTGKFYASAAKATSTLDGNHCVSARSKNVSVR